MTNKQVTTPEGFPPFQRKTAKEWRSEYSTRPEATCVQRLDALEAERVYHQERQRDLTREQEAINVRLGKIARERVAGATTPTT